MCYNVVEVIFYSALLHISDQNENLLEDCVDYLAMANRISEDKLNLMEECAQELVSYLLSDTSETPCMKMLCDIVIPDSKTNDTMRALERCRDIYLESIQDLLEGTDWEEDQLVQDAKQDSLIYPSDMSAETSDIEVLEYQEEEEEEEEEEEDEVVDMKKQIRMAEQIFTNLKSHMTDRERTDLTDIVFDMDKICERQPLHIYYASMHRHAI